MVLEKILESLLDCKEIKSVNLKEINPEYSLAGLMLKLKLQYFGHPMQRADSLEQTLMLGKIECRRRLGWDNPLEKGMAKLPTSVKSHRQRSLEGYSPWDHEERDTTECLTHSHT